MKTAPCGIHLRHWSKAGPCAYCAQVHAEIRAGALSIRPRTWTGKSKEARRQGRDQVKLRATRKRWRDKQKRLRAQV